MKVQPLRAKPRLRRLNCPGCGKKATLRRIVFGLPTEEFDYSRNISGGCVVRDDSPEIGCVECEWSGSRDPLTGGISAGNGVSEN